MARALTLASFVLVANLWGTAAARSQDPPEGDDRRIDLEVGLEAKLHFRESDLNSFPVNFPFGPADLPPGQDQAFLATVNPGSHLEMSTVTLFLDATLGEGFAARAKVDFIDLYDRNPTSEDKDIDVDEAWVRFGRETPPAVLPERRGAYLKLGKIPKLERQDDRHLESYGLAATAFNRFEDVGVELGFDLTRRLYVKLTATQGNPVFMRDPNALAGDNGTSDFRQPNPDPELASGIVILYDAEVEDLDVDGDLELGAGIGLRLGDATGRWGLELLGFGYERTLAETVELRGTFYGGDLDLLRGPFNQFPFPISGDRKREVGASLWLEAGGLSVFGQYVDQEIAGLDRIGWEASFAWTFDLPLWAAIGGRQLFPYLSPAVRLSRLEPDFRSPPVTPSPSFSWEWEKLDVGLRLGLVGRTDLTVEYADNDFVLGSGKVVGNDELLTTLRWRI